MLGRTQSPIKRRCSWRVAITPAAVALLTAAADQFENSIAAPQAAINERRVLTLALPKKSAVVRAKFLLQFAGSPAGGGFIAAY